MRSICILAEHDSAFDVTKAPYYMLVQMVESGDEELEEPSKLALRFVRDWILQWLKDANLNSYFSKQGIFMYSKLDTQKNVPQGLLMLYGKLVRHASAPLQDFVFRQFVQADARITSKQLTWLLFYTVYYDQKHEGCAFTARLLRPLFFGVDAIDVTKCTLHPVYVSNDTLIARLLGLQTHRPAEFKNLIHDLFMLRYEGKDYELLDKVYNLMRYFEEGWLCREMTRSWSFGCLHW
jgi:hypothetical protein